MARKMSNMGLKMKNIRENLGDTKRRKPRVQPPVRGPKFSVTLGEMIDAKRRSS